MSSILDRIFERKAADILRQRAASKAAFELAQKNKKPTRSEKLEAFSARVQKSAVKEIDEHFNQAGWKCGHYNSQTGIRTYGRADMPDCKLVYKGGTVTTMFKGEAQVTTRLKDPHTMQFIKVDTFVKQIQ